MPQWLMRRTMASASPIKPIQLIAAQPAAATRDVVARLVSQQMSERFGRQIVVDDRGDAAGIIATDLVRAPSPTRYTLLAVRSSIGANPGLTAKLPFDTRRTSRHCRSAAVGPNILVVGVASSLKA